MCVTYHSMDSSKLCIQSFSRLPDERRTITEQFMR